ncbi:MAG TPA: YfhO family protein [Bacteroidota bacterium]|nr:YfhO family protein [Bacteroidota bacterium]
MEKQEKKKHMHGTPPKVRWQIPSNYQHVAAGVVLLLSLIIFLAPVLFENKTFLGNDAVASLSWSTILREAGAQGVIPLWNPYIFCGMPAYANLTFSINHAFYNISAQFVIVASQVLQYILANRPIGYVVFYYLMLGLGMYALTFDKVKSKLIAVLAGLGAMFSTYVIIWVMIGHITKIKTICWLPWTILLIEKLRIRFDWRYTLLLILLFHFTYFPSHFQMIFYSFLIVGLYFLIFFINVIRKKEEWKSFLRTTAVVSATAVIALALDADKILTVSEYSKSSIRGAPSALQQTPSDRESPERRPDYAYATNWSFSPGEMMTFVLPSWYGFGIHPYNGNLAKEAVSVNTYWGPQPFVDGPQYMGIVILFFALLGLVRNRKEPFVAFLGVTVAVSLLIAFGKEFPVVYNLMFDYFPMFSKFRVPSMVLVLVQLAVPLLAAFGLASLRQPGAGFHPNGEKKLRYALYGLGSLLVLSLIGRGAVEVIYSSIFPIDEVGPKLAESLKTDQTSAVAEFYKFVNHSVSNDFSIALGLLLATVGVLWVHVKGLVRFTTVLVVLIPIALADLWRVDLKPMEPVTQQYQQTVFATPDYVRFLQQDTSLYRTVTFIDGKPPQDNILAYWKIENVYGYHAAKLRSYQDVLDAATLGNPLLLQLMNVKYIISNNVNTLTSRDTLLQVYDGSDGKIALFRVALPRAFFVRRWETAPGTDILKKIARLSFDPVDVAFVTDSLPIHCDPPQQGATAEYVRYGLQDLELRVTATGNNLLFLSEAYYPTGWKAFIDGHEVSIYRLDYMFRGLIVPAGTHKVEMRFLPDSFRIGRSISLAANILLVGGLAWAGFDVWRKRKKGATNTQA